MTDDQVEALSIAASPLPSPIGGRGGEEPSSTASGGRLLLRPRREPFEHGLLPIPDLMFSDGNSTLLPLRDKLLKVSIGTLGRVDAAALSDALQISPEYARLALDTLESVLPSDPDPDGAVDVRDLMLFLYIQSYKRLLPRPHKSAAAVADVWPSTSAFDGYLSAISPLQLVRNNSRRFMPSQADEEAHQLSYLQKHMVNILNLLSESAEGNSDESLVLAPESVEHLGFLIQFSEGVHLSQAVSIFPNFDPGMPAVPVSAAKVHDRLSQYIDASLEHYADMSLTKDNGLDIASMDATRTNDSVSQTRAQGSSSTSGSSASNNRTISRNLNFVQGISKAFVVKQPCDIKGHSVKGVRVEHCERLQITTATKRICVANCRECVLFLGVNQQPLFIGDNHKLQVAPFNTYYTQLEEHLAQVGVVSSINRWNEPLAIGMIDLHDPLSHPAGASDAQAESIIHLDPDQFTNFLIPNSLASEYPLPTNHNPFSLPETYKASQSKKHTNLLEIQQAIRDLEVEDNQKQELATALHVHFRDWLYASGNIRQLYSLQNEQLINVVS